MAGCAVQTGVPATTTRVSDEIRLDAPPGFDATLVHQGDAGIWTVACLPVYERYGNPAVVALDDKGRCIVLNCYSAKWTAAIAVQDGEWLGGVAHTDLDPARPGHELYVGGKRGNLYQLQPHPQGGFDANVIAHIPGREIHTLAAADFDRGRPGVELLVFTNPGALYLLTRDAQTGSFACALVETLPGRIRRAEVLQDSDGTVLGVATVSHAGQVGLLQWRDAKPVWKTLLQAPMGFSRLAVKPRRRDEPIVLYASRDDGPVLRLEQRPDGAFDAEQIFVGPQGPRGLAAGRFHADPQVESVAVFGYGGKVELLTREGDRWRVETVFEDVDKGHWLCTGEIDGRNATDEIFLSGYSQRVVMLSRPPGFGLRPETPVTPK